MEIIKIVLISIALVSLATLGLAIQVLLKRGGKFPNTHVSGNKHLRRQGIFCVQSYDRAEQDKVKKKIDYKNLELLKED